MNIIQRLIQEEDGIGVVEIILILVVLIALVAVFKDELTELVDRIFGKIRSGAEGIYD